MSQKVVSGVLLMANYKFPLLPYYYALKNLYKNSCIHDFKHRYKEIASEIGISESCLRKNAKKLIQAGVCWIDNKGTFRIMGVVKANELLSCRSCVHEKYVKKRVSLPISKKVKEFKLAIQVVIIENNFEEQKKAILRRVKNRSSANALKQTTSNRSQDKLSSRAVSVYLRSGVLPERGEEDVKINPTITISRRGYAKLLGKSASTAHRVIKALSIKGFLSDKRRKAKVLMANIPFRCFPNYLQSFPDRNVFWKDGMIMEVQCNKIDVTARRR